MMIITTENVETTKEYAESRQRAYSGATSSSEKQVIGVHHRSTYLLCPRDVLWFTPLCFSIHAYAMHLVHGDVEIV